MTTERNDGAAEEGLRPFESELCLTDWPEPARAQAFHGLAGDVVRAFEANTEADPIAILAQFLVSFGNAVGRGPYYQVEADKHFANEFALLVGATSRSRKGTSAGRVKEIFEHADPTWAHEHHSSGLSSGEGLIFAVRDPPTRSTNRDDGKGDLGVADKRLFVTEPEFARVFAAIRRSTNTLSSVVRQTWDTGNLASLTKNSPMRATNAHVSIVGHITEEELRTCINGVSIANGFTNRFLLLCVRRARLLPHGGDIRELLIGDLGNRTRAAIETARKRGRLRMTARGLPCWEKIYAGLSEESAGVVGAILGRAEAHTIRLGLLYALLDERDAIDVEHLTAASALWDYCARSALRIFGDRIGDPLVNKVHSALCNAGPSGMSRTQLRDRFGRHRARHEIEAALASLAELGRARRIIQHGTGGRPTEMWVACLNQKSAASA